MAYANKDAKPTPHTRLMIDHLKTTTRLHDGIKYSAKDILAELVRAGIIEWQDIATKQVMASIAFHCKKEGWMTSIGKCQTTRYTLNRAPKEEQQQKPLAEIPVIGNVMQLQEIPILALIDELRSRLSEWVILGHRFESGELS